VGLARPRAWEGRGGTVQGPCKGRCGGSTSATSDGRAVLGRMQSIDSVWTHSFQTLSMLAFVTINSYL
jgi:hypothetical protein